VGTRPATAVTVCSTAGDVLPRLAPSPL
jgi:hypothetical protein